MMTGRGVAVGLGFDAATLAPRDRLEALNAVIAGSNLPQQVRCADGVLSAHRTELYQLGPGVELIRNTGNCLLVDRTIRHVRLAQAGQQRERGLVLGEDFGSEVIDPGRARSAAREARSRDRALPGINHRRPTGGCHPAIVAVDYQIPRRTSNTGTLYSELVAGFAWTRSRPCLKASGTVLPANKPW
jgi:hypothetical protein